MLTPAEDAADTEPSFAELPADFIGLLCSALPVRDLVAAASTCKRWQTCVDTEWEGRCRARWHHWKTPVPPSNGLAAVPSSSSSSSSSSASWKRLYQMRHECDATIFNLLQDTCWPDRQEAAYSSLIAMGADAIDALAAAAHSSCASSMFVGLNYQAHVALHFVVGEMCAQQLQQLITAQQQQGADGASGGRQSAPPPPPPPPQSHGQTAAGEAAAATTEKADVIAALDGALLLAQALHPLSDVSAVKRLVQQLGAELRARIQQAQAAPGSRQAVQLLNKLLFGPPAAAATAATTSANSSGTQSKSPSAAAAAGAPAGAAGGPHAEAGPSSSSSSSGNGLRFGWWLRDAELDGPDLSQLAVPTDGYSGLGIKGNTSAYYDANNSCLDAVLGQRAGMPITLALLHAAVAVEAGLRVEMVNMPGHIINKAWVMEGTPDTAQAVAGLRDRAGRTANETAAASSSEQGPQGQQRGEHPNLDDEHVVIHDLTSEGSQLGIVHPLGQQQSSGTAAAASSGRWMYLDAFDGGREMEEQEIRQLVLRFVYDAQDPQLTLPGALDEVLQRWAHLTAPQCLRRMLMNLVNSLKLGYTAHFGRMPTIGASDLKLPPHLLHLRTISVALLALTLIPATTTQVREAFDVFAQMTQLVGLGQVAAPPGAVLLMRKIMHIMPPELHAWKVKLETMVGLYTQQRDQQLQVNLRSSHPSVQFRVGQYVLLRWPGAAPKTGFVLSWSVAEEPGPQTTYARWIAGGPAAAAAGAVASAIDAVGGQPTSQRTADPVDLVRYTLLLDDCTVEMGDQQNIVCYHCKQRPCSADESLHSKFERLRDKHTHKLKYMQHAWFERQFLRGLSEGGSSPSAAAETKAAFELVSWPEQHMALGQYFDAVRADGQPIAVANGALRAKFPEG